MSKLTRFAWKSWNMLIGVCLGIIATLGLVLSAGIVLAILTGLMYLIFNIDCGTGIGGEFYCTYYGETSLPK